MNSTIGDITDDEHISKFVNICEALSLMDPRYQIRCLTLNSKCSWTDRQTEKPMRYQMASDGKLHHKNLEECPSDREQRPYMLGLRTDMVFDSFSRSGGDKKLITKPLIWYVADEKHFLHISGWSPETLKVATSAMLLSFGYDDTFQISTIIFGPRVEENLPCGYEVKEHIVIERKKCE